MPTVLSEPQSARAVTDIVTLIVILVCSPTYIKNPYLLAKLVEIMFTVNPLIQNTAKDFCDQLYCHRIALDHLMPSLMRFYVGTYVNTPLSYINNNFFFDNSILKNNLRFA